MKLQVFKSLPLNDDLARAAISWMLRAFLDLGSISIGSST